MGQHLFLVEKIKFGMNAVQKYKDYILDIFPELSGSQKCYLIALMMIPFLLVWMIVPIPNVQFPIAVCILLLFTIGIVIDVLGVYNWLWSKSLGKALILVAYAAILNVALALSDQIVNEIVGNISSKLTYSISFASILLIPLFLAGVVVAAFIFLFTFGQVYLFAKC